MPSTVSFGMRVSPRISEKPSVSPMGMLFIVAARKLTPLRHIYSHQHSPISGRPPKSASIVKSSRGLGQNAVQTWDLKS